MTTAWPMDSLKASARRIARGLCSSDMNERAAARTSLFRLNGRRAAQVTILLMQIFTARGGETSAAWLEEFILPRDTRDSRQPFESIPWWKRED